MKKTWIIKSAYLTTYVFKVPGDTESEARHNFNTNFYVEIDCDQDQSEIVSVLENDGQYEDLDEEE